MFSEYTGLYFYSALIQSNAALFAVVGIFVIYKLQSLENMIDTMPTKLSYVFSGVVLHPKITEFAVGGKVIRQNIISTYEATDNSTARNAVILFKRWMYLIEAIRPTKKKIKLPMLLMGIGIVLNSILIVLSEPIHNCLGYLEIVIFAAIIIYQSVIIYTIYRTIKGLVLAFYDR